VHQLAITSFPTLNPITAVLRVMAAQSTFMICFMSKVLPAKDLQEESFTALFYFVYSQRLTFSTFSLISIFNCDICLKHDIVSLC